MSLPKQIHTVEIKIERFSSKGNGIGLFQKKDGTYSEAEISFAVPGDLLMAELTSKKRGKWKGKIQEILVPSPYRRKTLCKHFSLCGGCRWQQISYEEQLAAKQSLLKNIFSPILPPALEVLPILGSHSEWRYRNKMEFTFSSDLNKNKYLGLIIDASKGKVLNLSECHLVNPWFLDLVRAVKEWWDQSSLDAYHMPSNRGSLRNLILREGIHTGDRMIVLVVSGQSEFALSQELIDGFVSMVRKTIAPIAEDKTSIILRKQIIAKGVPTQFVETVLYGKAQITERMHIQVNPEEPASIYQFLISPLSFFQPNTKQAELFYSRALQLARINKDSVVYDLYCGTGTLGICCSRVAKQVVGIELSSEAAADAVINMQLNACDNMVVYAGDVKQLLSQKKAELPAPDIVLIDPPRSGLDSGALQLLLDLNPPTILSISCNPQTQALNIADLVKHGYEIEVVQPVDQFPQTMHLENIVRLTKKI